MDDSNPNRPIKEYATVHRHDEALTFRALRMEDHFNETVVQAGGHAEVPHRHQFYTVLSIQKGRGTHTIDYRSYPIKDYQLLFVGTGQVHHVVEESRTIGHVLLFSTDFLHRNGIALSFLEDLYLYNDYSESPPFSLRPDQVRSLGGYCEQILSLEKSGIQFWEQAVGAVLNRISKKSSRSEIHKDLSDPHTGVFQIDTYLLSMRINGAIEVAPAS